MSNEKENAFKEWFDRGPVAPGHEAIFSAGWDAAFESRPIVVDTIRIVARQGERAEIQKAMMERAVEAFRIGLDDRARFYRELTEELFGKGGQ